MASKRPVKTVMSTEVKVAQICEKAREQIYAKVLAHYRKHPGSAWSGHYLVDLEKTIKALYAQMGVDIGGEFRAGLPKTMREFYDMAAADMRKAGKRNAILGKPDTERINYFLNNSFEQIAMRTQRMSFDHIKQLRTISADVLRTASLTGASRKQVTKELLAKATEIPGFKFTAANGAVWKDETYFKMLARTELINAGRTAYDDTCAQNGYDVVMLDFSGNSCEACAQYEGCLFSLTGATPGLPTKDDLISAGVFHPNCTHSYTAVPDFIRETEFNPDGTPKAGGAGENHKHSVQHKEEKQQPAPKPKPEPAAAQKEKQSQPQSHKELRQEQLKRARQTRLQRECDLVGCTPIKGQHTVTQDLADTNPHYDPNKIAYSYNCQRCVTTYEARRRGLDVTALPTYKGDTWPNGQKYATAYKNAHIIKCDAARSNGARANVERNVLAAPDGARFIVRIGVKGNPLNGHVFIAENRGGKVAYVDPQIHGDNRQADASSHWDWASGKRCTCMRVDNLKFTDKLKEVCEVKK